MSAKVTLSIQDRSTVVAALGGVATGIVVDSLKGESNKPRLFTSYARLEQALGGTTPKLGVSMYSAKNILTQSNALWVVKASNKNSRMSGALVRSKVVPISDQANDAFDKDSLVICPLENGLTQSEYDKFNFPLYFTNKVYGETEVSLQAFDGNELLVNTFGSLIKSRGISFSRNLLTDLNDKETDLGEKTKTYTIVDLYEREYEFDLLTLETAVSVKQGTEVLKSDGSSFTSNPRVSKSVINSKEIMVTNSDYIPHGSDVKIGDTTVKVLSKRLHKETQKIILLDSDIKLVDVDDEDDNLVKNDDFRIIEVLQSEVEERDALLVVNKSIGSEEVISIGTSPSKNFPEKAFTLNVYLNGEKVESYEVSRFNTLDGYGRQLEIEQKINRESNYIIVKNNLSNVNEDGSYDLPLFSEYAVWQQNPDDIFIPSGLVLAENLLKKHIEVKYTGTDDLEIGNRIKFATTKGLSKEYKILSIDSVNKSLIIDRPLEEDQISMTTLDNDGNEISTKIMFFDKDFNDHPNNVWDGIKYYNPVKLDKPYPGYKIGEQLNISTVIGKILDPGVNLLLGSLRVTVTLSDMINAANLLKNKEKTPINLIIDGGYTDPSYAIALDNIAKSHGPTCHAFISTPLEAEFASDVNGALKEYVDSLNLSTSYNTSGFCGWVKQFDEFSQTYVWTSPESYGAAAQSFVTREYTIFSPAAGWKRGVVNGLDVAAKFDDGDRDYIVDTLRLNPIRYKEGSGLVIWGNETLLKRQSPLQLRSVAMLLIFISNGLNSMLEQMNFDLNDETAWGPVEGSINAFMRDDVKGKGGVYDYRVAVESIITDTDIDNRRMPVFLGIQPTMDIQEIPVSVGIYNKSAEISVSV